MPVSTIPTFVRVDCRSYSLPFLSCILSLCLASFLQQKLAHFCSVLNWKTSLHSRIPSSFLSIVLIRCIIISAKSLPDSLPPFSHHLTLRNVALSTHSNSSLPLVGKEYTGASAILIMLYFLKYFLCVIKYFIFLSSFHHYYSAKTAMPDT